MHGSCARLARATLGAALLALIVPVSVHADSTFFLKTVSLSPTTETVTLSIAVPPLAGCPITPPYCKLVTTNVRVSPCPPGMPCTSGGWEFSLEGPFPTVDIDLATGTTYTFTGDGVTEVGPLASPCTYTCSSPWNIGDMTYQTHGSGEVGHWDIQVLGSSAGEDTIFVAATIVDVNSTTNSCVDNIYNCYTSEMFVQITPCPLALSGYSNSCSSGQNHLLWWQAWPTPITFALLRGETYTVSGYFDTATLYRSNQGVCEPQRTCVYTEYPSDGTFTAEPLATRPITWGHLKALYRE